MNEEHTKNYKSVNMVGTGALRVGVVYWHRNDGVVSLISHTFEDLGCQVTNFMANETLPEGLDVIFVYGPYGSLVSLADQLLACHPSRRPAFVFWQSEQFANPTLPEWLRYPVSKVRSKIDRVAFRNRDRQGSLQYSHFFQWMATKATRFRYYGDLHWLSQNGLISILVVASAWTADFLRTRGFNVVAIPGFGFPVSAEWGEDLKLERDIPVLWLGKIGSKRRGRLLKRIRAELRTRGIEMLVIDGVEHPYIFGKERTVLLNRTKVALNLLRTKWDENAMRYYLAGLNRALIVTEPTLPHHPPFVSGTHLIEAPIDQITDTICYYLSHEEERQRIVDQAYQLVITELTLKNALSEILETVMAQAR